MPQSKTPYLLLIAALAIGLLFAVGSCQAERKLQQLTSHNVATLLTMNETYKRNAEGQLVTAKNSLILQAKEFTKIKGVKDSTIRLLQAAVKAAGKKTSSAVVFTAVTHDHAYGAVDSIRYEPRKSTVSSSDTASIVEMAPVYYGYVQGPGFKGLVRADPDSVALLNYTVTQKYTVAFADKQVLITPLGTNTQASEVQAFQLPPAKKPKRGLWAIGGGVVGLFLVLLL
jgi:hypothetical protein